MTVGTWIPIVDYYDNELESEIIIPDIEGHKEGFKRVYFTTKYERDPKNRRDAIRIFGTSCAVCGFNFEERYGHVGKGFIEIHHKIPLATKNEEVIINPFTDLVCVCSNCHRMLHHYGNQVMTVENLKAIIEANQR